MYGKQAAEHVAERIGALAVLGDQDGIDRWMERALRLDQLSGGVSQ